MRTGQTACCPTLNRFNRAGENSKTGLRTSIGGNGAVVSPGTQPRDIFVAGDPERARGAGVKQHKPRGEVPLFGKKPKKFGDDWPLGFFARENLPGRSGRRKNQT